MPVDRLSGFNMGVSMKVACQCVATTPLTLSGSQTIDGVPVGSNAERVLVTSQPDPVDNGIWVANSSSWVRAADCDGARDLLPGSLVYVDRGNFNPRTFWVFNSSSPAASIIPGRDPLNIVQSIKIFAVTPWVIDNWFNVNSSAEGLARLGGISIVTSSTSPTPTIGYNARAFGCAGDGITNDTSNMQAAMTAAAGDRLFIPAGRYLLEDRITCGSINIEGAGKAETELRWASGIPAAGLGIYLSSHTQAARVADLSLTTLSSASTDTALYISATNTIEIGSSFTTSPGTYDRALVENVQIQGGEGTDSFNYFQDGWGIGITLVNCNNASIRDCNVTGRAETPWSGSTGIVGVLLCGSPFGQYENGHPNAITCSNNNVWFCDFGWYVDNYEGFYMTGGNNTVACNIGSNITGSSIFLHPQANIINNHFNCRDDGISISNQTDVNISENLIFQIQNSNAYNGVNIHSTENLSYNISNNIFSAASTSSGSMNGIFTMGHQGVMSNNIFRQYFNSISAGIITDSAAYQNIGRDNLFMGPAAAAGMVNLGAASNVVSVTMSSDL